MTGFYPNATRRFPLEDEWARELPERFQLVVDTDFVRVYALNR